MSFVSGLPELVAAAAADLAGIGSSVSAANGAAALPTIALVAAGTDEESAAIAAVFDYHVRQYQALSAQVIRLQQQFVTSLAAAGDAYVAAEAAAAEPLQALLDFVNAPSEALTGRPLIGNGADASTLGGSGGNAGWLYGTGGNGGNAVGTGGHGGNGSKSGDGG